MLPGRVNMAGFKSIPRHSLAPCSDEWLAYKYKVTILTWPLPHIPIQFIGFMGSLDASLKISSLVMADWKRPLQTCM